MPVISAAAVVIGVLRFRIIYNRYIVIFTIDGCIYCFAVLANFTSYPAREHCITVLIKKISLTLDVVSLASRYLTGGKEIIVVVISICIIFCSTRLYCVNPVFLNTSASLVCVEGMIRINVVLFVYNVIAFGRYPTGQHLAVCIEEIGVALIYDLLVGCHLTGSLEIIPLFLSILIVIRCGQSPVVGDLLSGAVYEVHIAVVVNPAGTNQHSVFAYIIIFSVADTEGVLIRIAVAVVAVPLAVN